MKSFGRPTFRLLFALIAISLFSQNVLPTGGHAATHAGSGQQPHAPEEDRDEMRETSDPDLTVFDVRRGK